MLTPFVSVLAADAHETTFLVWDVESQQQFPAAEEARSSKSILVKQISYAKLRTTRSWADDFKDLELSLILSNNNLHAVVLPLAVCGVAEDPFVFAFESSATLDCPSFAFLLPLTVIRAFVASNLYAESSLNFDSRGSSAPSEPVWEYSGGANQESTRNARHHDSVDVSAKQIE